MLWELAPGIKERTLPGEQPTPPRRGASKEELFAQDLTRALKRLGEWARGCVLRSKPFRVLALEVGRR